MKNSSTIVRFAVAALLGFATGCGASHSDSGAETALDAELRALDRELALADKYVADHQQRIFTIENMLHSRGVSLEQQFHIYEQLYDEYEAYQFDKAMQMLDKQVEIAVAMRDRSRVTDVELRRAKLYTTSGMFFEASVLLNNDIDTLALSHSQLVDYYDTQQRFHLEFNAYTQTPEMNLVSERKVRFYRDRILQETAPDSELHRRIVTNICMDEKDWSRADSLNRLLLSHCGANNRSYASYAYTQARICESMGLADEHRLWFIRSAMTDIRCAIKDNASLCSLATILLQDKQVDRAFRYITFSLSDALFYNAKLRPWQIASAIPLIENAYRDSQTEQEAATRRQMRIISVLALALAAICGYVFYQYRRSRKMHHEVERMNRQIEGYNVSLSDTNSRLKNLNNALNEANAVKDVYIGMFLSLCSDYIEKLSTWRRNVRKSLSANKISELREELASQDVILAELETFYDMFDNAFLTLFPDFVEEFNGLLKPEARIVLKKGERMNTELRIFALVRLGITDSQRIASLLRYSVNTIYNYRVRVRNNALGSRDDFEERLKTIGTARTPEM